MRITLTVTEGPHTGTCFTFAEHDTFIVGRSPRTRFRLPEKDKAVSRFHFIIELNPPLCRILDMASTNGTFVNGARVAAASLNDGDTIRAGQSVLTVAVDTRPSPSEADLPADLEFATVSGTDTGPPASVGPGPAGATVEWVPDPSLPRIPGYRVEREIGRGGMGVVYCATDLRNGERVALKTIRPGVVATGNAVARFLREATILRRLEHPNIVRFHECGQADLLLYFTMQYAPGTDARRLVRKQGPQSVSRAVGLTIQVLDALAYAHHCGFVHRDIKPANLLLTRLDGEPTVKLADFGLARIYQDSPLSGLSLLGDFSGTVGYLPPEQILDFRSTRPSADQYAVAATLYYLLTGSPIFDFPPEPVRRVQMILEQDPLPIQQRRREIPDAVADVIHRALAREPEDRYPDVEAMRAALFPFAS